MREPALRSARALGDAWVAVARTHRGNHRKCNEDAVSTSASVWAVADGMGGHSAGDYASAAIAAALGAPGVSNCTLSDRVDWIEDQLLDVDIKLQRRAQQMGAGTVIGSTVVSLTIEYGTAVVLWAGDSRLYRLREGQLELVTRDHNPVSDLLDCGGVTEEQALAADTNVITRAVGGQRPLELDVAVFDVRDSDVLLLCSDGLYRELLDWELAEILEQRDMEAAADTLVERTLSRSARDNLSLVLLRSSTSVHH